MRTRRGCFATLAATDRLAVELDECQFALEQGPVLHAARGKEWCRSGEIGADSRWPRWAAEARESELHSALSSALQGEQSPFGALTIYSRCLNAFTDGDQVDLALLCATQAALTLASLRKARGLATALQSRHLIGTAQGILIERYGLDLNRAFTLLQRCSSTTNTKLTDIAQRLLDTGQLPCSTIPATSPRTTRETVRR